MTRPRRASVLLISQYAQPASFSAARRTHGFTKYLERRGHRVTVLTSPVSGTGPVPGASRSIRSRDLVSSRLNWRSSNLESLRGGGEASYAAPSPIASWIPPDLSIVGWLPFLLPRALEAARRGDADCVITTSPPESCHLAGLALARAGVPWIADLRDGWMFESTHPEWALPALRRIDGRLERLVAEHADLLTTVTDEITEDIRSRLGARAETVPNGFDPDERMSAEPGDAGLDPVRHSLVHTGRMAFAGRSPRPLLDALELLRVKGGDLASRLEIVFAGPLSTEESELIGRAEDDGSVKAVGTLPRESTLRLQSAADTLLLLTGKDRRSEATAKLYEYLATGNPILVLGVESAAARIVTETASGLSVSATDPAEIAAALERMVDAPAVDRDAAQGDASRERYSYERIAESLSEHVERLVRG